MSHPIAEYRFRRRVQFHETDMAGIVHFSSFFKYMEEAEHAMWREAGLSIAVPGSDIGWPRVATAFDFHRPLYFEEEFEVCLRITAITKKSIRYSCVLTRDDTKIATGTLVIVCVRKSGMEPMKSFPIPPDVASRFQVVPETGA